jgi:mono/diheme cytochrome c family protein
MGSSLTAVLRRSAIALSALIVPAVLAVPPATAAGAAPVREGPGILKPAEHRVGQLIADVSFTDTAGKPGKLSYYRRRILVVCMTGAGCPVAKKYGPVLAGIEAKYRDRGVAMLMVNATSHEAPGDVKAFVAASGFAGRYVRDADGAFARALGARSSTDAFVLDCARTLVYRGAADDQFGLGYSIAKPRRQFLVEAIEAALKGERPVTAATSAPGCELTLPASAAPAAAPQAVTYHNRVSRVIQQSCIDCHRPGENGPFSLTSYDDVKGNLATIKRVVRRGVMPPWYASPEVGRWSNDRSLTAHDRDDLLAWIDAGAPEGDPADAPAQRQYAMGWKIGTPDAVFETPQSFKIPATGAMEYQRIAVQTHLPEDKWVKAIEIRPTSPAVVHHVLVFAVYPPNHPRLGEQPRYRDGLDGYFAGLVPGQGHVVYPHGVAKFLPRETLLIFQIHYTPNGAATEDRPKIGVLFNDGRPEHEISTRGVFNTKFKIPPGDPNFAVTAAHYFRNPVRLLSFMPHSHVRGKAFRYEMLYPDGRREVVLDVPGYDFNWQLEYHLARPLDVPAGTRLRVTAWYDNSDKNPANPDPTARVRFGDQTWDEMMIGYFSGYRLP